MLAKSSKKYILNRINAFIISIFIDFGHYPLPLRNVLYTKCPTFVYFAICWFAALCPAAAVLMLSCRWKWADFRQGNFFDNRKNMGCIISYIIVHV